MKRLIINADDFGMQKDIDRGIMDCYAKGAVTDVSLMAVGDSFENAIHMARENSMDTVGIHLVLTGEFYPASAPDNVRSLVGNDHKFYKSYIAFLIRYFMRSFSTKEIYSEFKSQVIKIKKEGLKISHINSHQHLHILPAILKIVIRLAEEEGISNIRFPFEKINVVRSVRDPRVLLRNISLASVCAVSKKLLKTSNVNFNEYFIGHAEALKLNKENLVTDIMRLRGSITELGCHPGYFTEDVRSQYPYYKNCENELNFLCQSGLIDTIKKYSIQPISHADL